MRPTPSLDLSIPASHRHRQLSPFDAPVVASKEGPPTSRSAAFASYISVSTIPCTGRCVQIEGPVTDILPQRLSCSYPFLQERHLVAPCATSPKTTTSTHHVPTRGCISFAPLLTAAASGPVPRGPTSATSCYPGNVRCATADGATGRRLPAPWTPRREEDARYCTISSSAPDRPIDLEWTATSSFASLPSPRYGSKQHSLALAYTIWSGISGI